MKETIKVINSIRQAGIITDYAIGGAFAMLFYTEPQETFDIDIFVHFPQGDSPIITLDPLKEYLEENGHTIQGEHFFIHGIPVQFLAVGGLTEDALNNAVVRSFDEVSTKVFTMEHLAAIMVSLRRPKDKTRLALLLGLDEFDHEKFQSILSRFNLVHEWKKLKVLYE